MPEKCRILIGAGLDQSASFILEFTGVVVSRNHAINVHLTEHFTSEALVKATAAACLMEAGVLNGELKDTTELFIVKLKENKFILNKNQLNPLPHRIILKN